MQKKKNPPTIVHLSSLLLLFDSIFEVSFCMCLCSWGLYFLYCYHLFFYMILSLSSVLSNNNIIIQFSFGIYFSKHFFSIFWCLLFKVQEIYSLPSFCFLYQWRQRNQVSPTLWWWFHDRFLGKVRFEEIWESWYEVR